MSPTIEGSDIFKGTDRPLFLRGVIITRGCGMASVPYVCCWEDFSRVPFGDWTVRSPDEDWTVSMNTEAVCVLSKHNFPETWGHSQVGVQEGVKTFRNPQSKAYAWFLEGGNLQGLRQTSGKHYYLYFKARSKIDTGNQITSLRYYISKVEKALRYIFHNRSMTFGNKGEQEHYIDV